MDKTGSKQRSNMFIWPKIIRCKIWNRLFHVDHQCHNKISCWHRVVTAEQIKRMFKLIYEVRHER